jgi:hypothetical protein
VVTLIQDPWLGFGWNTTETAIVLGITVACVGLTYLLLKYPYWPLMIRGLIPRPKKGGTAPRSLGPSSGSA